MELFYLGHIVIISIGDTTHFFPQTSSSSILEIFLSPTMADGLECFLDSKWSISLGKQYGLQ